MPPEDGEVLVRLPDDNRDTFKEALGPIVTETEALRDSIGDPVVTIGDVVSYHFQESGIVPDVAVVDGRTKRTAVDPAIESALADVEAVRIAATNPAGTITRSLLRALETAIGRDESVQIVVDGEEDLAAVPAILLAPIDASVFYGQPGEGMVHVRVSSETKARARHLASLFEGKSGLLQSLDAD